MIIFSKDMVSCCFYDSLLYTLIKHIICLVINLYDYNDVLQDYATYWFIVSAQFIWVDIVTHFSSCTYWKWLLSICISIVVFVNPMRPGIVVELYTLSQSDLLNFTYHTVLFTLMFYYSKEFLIIIMKEIIKLILTN